MFGERQSTTYSNRIVGRVFDGSLRSASEGIGAAGATAEVGAGTELCAGLLALVPAGVEVSIEEVAGVDERLLVAATVAVPSVVVCAAGMIALSSPAIGGSGIVCPRAYSVVTTATAIAYSARTVLQCMAAIADSPDSVRCPHGRHAIAQAQENCTWLPDLTTHAAKVSED